MNLVRLGHYFTPHTPVAGSCQTALVCSVTPAEPVATVENPDKVSLAVWKENGAVLGNRQDVPVLEPGQTMDASFHLSGECPWYR